MDTIGYYKDLFYSKLRNYIQPYISTNYNVSKITENIYLSDLASAFNKEKLKEDGITHILTLILGIDPMYPNDFKYKNINVRDVSHESLDNYFEDANNFIDDAIKGGGKILIHCSYGVSRSASIVIAYLISKRGKNYEEAYNYVKERRSIIEPNEGFKEQLVKYSDKNKKI